jgi:hypothetical protein
MAGLIVAADHQGARPMRLTAFLVVAGILAVTASAYAETPDCATFPGDRAKFTCYDNVSRAPKPDPEVARPSAKAKPATNSRKAGREN